MCQHCQQTYLVPNPHVRTLDSGLKVLSFFPYDEIDFLLKTKHTPLGFYIYTLLAKKTMPFFAQAFKYDTMLSVVPVDDRTPYGYAHTAILARYLQSSQLYPSYATLKSGNNVRYSGKPLAYRLTHTRDFRLLKTPPFEVLLVDDIVTTGATLTQAARTLLEKNISTLMAVVLADANR